MLKINLTICSKSGITLSIQNIHSKNLCNRMVVLFYFIYLFILMNYFWLRWVFVAMCRLLIVVASLVVEHGLQACQLPQLWLAGSRAQAQQLRIVGCRAQAQQLQLAGCRAQAQQLRLAGSRAQAQQLWHMGLAALQHVGSSQTRARTRVPCIGGGFLTTVPPGKSQDSGFKFCLCYLGIMCDKYSIF